MAVSDRPSTPSAAAALRGAAALAACQLRGARDDMALLFDDLTAIDLGRDDVCDPMALAVAAVELTAAAWSAMAEYCGRPADDFAAGIASNYAGLVGSDNASALVCYASAMAVGGAPDLCASMLARATEFHGDVGTAIAAVLVLATAWEWQARDEGCAAADIASRVCTAASV